MVRSESSRTQAFGAGSGLAGESLGNGLILDMAYGMRRPIEFGVDYARIQAGMPLAQLNTSGAGETFRQHYTEDLVERVGALYEEDVVALGYTFD